MKKWIIISIIIFVGIVSGCLSYMYYHNISNQTNISDADTLQNVEIEKKVYNRRPVPEFTQGLYVTAYTASLKKFDQLLAEAKASGINTIVFDIKEMQGDVYCEIRSDSTLHRFSEVKLWDIDTVIDKIHSYDMNAVARIVQFFNIASAKKYPELLIAHKSGGYWSEKRGKLTWLDSSNPLVQSDLKALIKKVADTKVDEIQLDYVRFPTEGDLSQAQFYFQKIDAEKAQTDTSYVKRQKKDIIAQYLKDLKEICDEYQIRLSADIFAIVAWQRDVDIRNTGQDISMMTPHLNHLHPMIYSSHFARNFNYRSEDIYNHPYSIVKEGLDLTRQYSHPNCKVIPYLQAFNWKVNYTKTYLFDQFKAVIDSRCPGYILWNAGNHYTQTLSWVKEWNQNTPYLQLREADSTLVQGKQSQY